MVEEVLKSEMTNPGETIFNNIVSEVKKLKTSKVHIGIS